MEVPEFIQDFLDLVGNALLGIITGKYTCYNAPGIYYDLSSLDLDYLSPEIFKYMDYEGRDVQINLILDNKFDKFTLVCYIQRFRV
ncbi:hypothetical protein C4B25_00355 [Mycoplasma todarodis]|uniref:Uncharacterized protein n=1 Tax=Mycoplasma todarodis TaxID=1937191 RepID=A0A4R0XN10_9MOLU|nr:hypothetical protein C4B25_00355 [Mycoplasma todarodis]